MKEGIYMTKIDIISGFLGAGKTTLIKKLINDSFKNQKIILIENEFGQIAIDGGFLKDYGIDIKEMNSGCICCSLVGDFSKALKEVVEKYNPDRILIEPSGVGKLSDVIKAVGSVLNENVILNSYTTVSDASKFNMYLKNFGEFYLDQLQNAKCIVLSHTSKLTPDKINSIVDSIKEINKSASVVTTDWDIISGDQILQSIERTNDLDAELKELLSKLSHHHHDDDEDEEHHHHHHHDGEECDDPDCECHHHHDDDDDEDHHHHHHHDGEECDDPDCECHHHHDDDDDEDHHHHHHHADEVFSSWGIETTRQYSIDDINEILNNLSKEEYGFVLRAKGMVPSFDSKWIHFDYVPGEPDVRFGSAFTIGRICVIGSKISEEKLNELFSKR